MAAFRLLVAFIAMFVLHRSETEGKYIATGTCSVRHIVCGYSTFSYSEKKRFDYKMYV